MREVLKKLRGMLNNDKLTVGRDTGPGLDVVEVENGDGKATTN